MSVRTLFFLICWTRSPHFCPSSALQHLPWPHSGKVYEVWGDLFKEWKAWESIYGVTLWTSTRLRRAVRWRVCTQLYTFTCLEAVQMQQKEKYSFHTPLTPCIHPYVSQAAVWAEKTSLGSSRPPLLAFSKSCVFLEPKRREKDAFQTKTYKCGRGLSLCWSLIPVRRAWHTSWSVAQTISTGSFRCGVPLKPTTDCINLMLQSK